MLSAERRQCKRFRLNHPIMMGTNKTEPRLAEIIDAGTRGLRIRVTNQEGLRVGREVDLSCLGLARKGRRDLRLRCRVAWEDPENFEVGLDYIQ